MSAHLDALTLRLFNERSRLAASTTDKERKFRAVLVSGIEREIAGELDFLGMTAGEKCDLTDDELLAELTV